MDWGSHESPPWPDTSVPCAALSLRSRLWYDPWHGDALTTFFPVLLVNPQSIFGSLDVGPTARLEFAASGTEMGCAEVSNLSLPPAALQDVVSIHFGLGSVQPGPTGLQRTLISSPVSFPFMAHDVFLLHVCFI